jgi:hypothetical protein
MAKVIRATPTLTGQEAIAFLEKMKRIDSARPSKADLKLIKLIQSHSKQFNL